MKIFQAFDFYCNGNIGDDLMLSGFLKSWGTNTQVEWTSMSKLNARVGTRRFPQMAWHLSHPAIRKRCISECDVWLGIGDTPFQVSNGPWFIDLLLRDARQLQDVGKAMVMVGVGTEAEIAGYADRIRPVLRCCERIWTRDHASRDILVEELGMDPERVFEGADLANVALRSCFDSSRAPCSGDLAVTYFSESPTRTEREELRRFLEETSRHCRVAILANEVRPRYPFERGVYKKLYGGLSGIRGRTAVELIVPDYDEAHTVPELIRPYTTFGTVMTARYHGLLTAAWAGCRVAAIGTRSKVGVLAKELDVPVVSSPLDCDALRQGYENARPVARQRLDRLADKAEAAVVGLRDWIQGVAHVQGADGNAV